MTRVMDGVRGGGGGGIGPPPPSGERSPRLTEAILYLESGYTKKSLISMWIKEAKLCI